MTPAPQRPLLLGLEWPSDNPGGMHRYLSELIDALHEAGTTARAVVLGPATDAPVGVLAAASARAGLAQRYWTYWRAATRASVSADLVDAHFALFAFGPVVLGSLRRLPLVVHFQGPWAAESRREGRHFGSMCRTRMERAVYRRANKLVTLSFAFKRLLVESYGVSPWRVAVIPPGVDLRCFSPGDPAAARAVLGLPSAGPVVVTARRLVRRTGVDLLLDAWGSVSARRPDAYLLVVGDGPERQRLEAKAAALGLDGSVRFLGAVDEETLVAAYRAADLAVVPSVALEGFGMVVLEALACGTPVVVTAVGGLPETVSRLERSLVVADVNPAALAERLERALDGGQRPSRDQCRQYAEAFRWDAVARRHGAIYREAVTRQRRRLRVVFIDHCAQLSGGELALLRLLPALDDVDAHVILGEEGPLLDKLGAAGISAEVLPMPEAARGVQRDRVRPGSLPVAALTGSTCYVARLARRLRSLRADLVHTNSLKAALYGGAAARLAGQVVVWHIRDRVADGYLPGPARVVVRAMARTLPHAVIANSRSTLECLGTVGVPQSVIYSPVPPVPADRRTGREHGNDAVLRVGIVGRLAPWKGQAVFLDAFAAAFAGDHRAEGLVIGAALFGEDGYQQELERRARSLGIRDRVDFRGFREDVVDELQTLDVLVHASTLPEPFGAVVVEGMAAGLAIVAADAGGPAEVVTHGVDGLLYRPGDVPALASALRLVAADRSLRARLGSAARRRAADFEPALIARQVMTVYQSLAGTR